MLRVSGVPDVCVAVVSELITEPYSPAGKRRYDRKQSGYGGQTKPIFRKKVRPPFTVSFTAMNERCPFLIGAFHYRLRLQRRLS